MELAHFKGRGPIRYSDCFNEAGTPITADTGQEYSWGFNNQLGIVTDGWLRVDTNAQGYSADPEVIIGSPEGKFSLKVTLAVYPDNNRWTYFQWAVREPYHSSQKGYFGGVYQYDETGVMYGWYYEDGIPNNSYWEFYSQPTSSDEIVFEIEIDIKEREGRVFFDKEQADLQIWPQGTKKAVLSASFPIWQFSP